MARFMLTIECDNAAFDEDCNAEVACILSELSIFIGKKVCFLKDMEVGSVRDANGHRTGNWDFVPSNRE